MNTPKVTIPANHSTPLLNDVMDEAVNNLNSVAARLSEPELKSMLGDAGALPSGEEVEAMLRKTLNKRVKWYKRPEVIVGAIGVAAVAGTAAAFTFKLRAVNAAHNENPDVIDVTED